MNKQEAADFLGVSVRALERYVQQGKISVKYEKGKTRSTANFDAVELEAFRVELNQPSYKPAVETRQTPQQRQTTPKDESRQNSPDNQPQTDKNLLHSGEIATFDGVDELSVIDKLSIIIETLLNKSQTQLSLSIADKLLLKLPEAQALTGLSREILRSAIKQGTLKAEKIGRSWRIKRTDLDEYVAKLF